MMINCLCIRTKNAIDHRRYLVNTLFKLNCINILVVQIMLVEDDGIITRECDGWFSKGENNRRFSDTETIAITPWKVYRAAKYFNNICITTEVVRMPLLVKKLSIIAPLNPYSFKKSNRAQSLSVRRRNGQVGMLENTEKGFKSLAPAHNLQIFLVFPQHHVRLITLVNR